MTIGIQAKNLYSFLINTNFYPSNTFMYAGAEKVTYQKLHEQIEKIRRESEEQGIVEGDLVAVQLPSSHTLIYLLLALWKQGASVFLIDVRLKADERLELFAKTTPRFFISSESSLSIAAISDIEMKIEKLDDSDIVIDAPLLLSTSGSTGSPKIVGRTYESIHKEIIRFINIPDGIHAKDVIMILSPITFSYGLMSALLPSLYIGAGIIMPSIRTNDIISSILKYKVSVIYGVPYHYNLLQSTYDGTSKQANLSSLRACISAGERLTIDVFNLFKNKFGVKIGQLYGMTELGLISVDFKGEYCDSVGVPLVSLQLKDNHIFVEQEYSPYIYNMDESLYTSPWLKTGDVGVLTEQALYIKGRSDSLIIKGGIKFYLSEVEEVLRRSIYIKDVTVQSNIDGGDVIAYLEIENIESIDLIVSYIKSNISNHKSPGKLVFLKSFPRTMSGKLDKKQLNNILPIQEVKL